MSSTGRQNNAVVELCVEDLSHDGRGVARLDGLTVFVFGALPGETVHAKVVAKKRQYWEAETVEVLVASSERVEPVCEAFGRCGGCVLQHLTPEAQLAHKQKVLLEQLKHFGGTEPKAVLPPLSGPQEGYRHKARLGVRYVAKKGGALVGFRERNGRYLADITSCPVLHPSVGRDLRPLRELITSLECKQSLPQIEVAVSDDETALVVRHLNPLSLSDREALIAFAQAHGYRLYLQPKGPKTVHQVWPEEEAPLSYRLPQFDVKIEFNPSDFTQVNRELNLSMLDQAVALLDLQKTDRVLDLFCGLGNFTLPVASQVDFALGVEADEPMIEKAQHNARINQLNDAEFRQADLFSDDIQTLDLGQYHFNKVLLDPPRAGAEAMMHELARLKIGHIVYVSCNPATLARDVGILTQQYGYQLEAAGVMDMFPHTSHVEAMALLKL